MAATEYDSGHGWYQAMTVRGCDDAPRGASHAVFDEPGGIAGYVSAGAAWDHEGGSLGRAGGLRSALVMVAECDLELQGMPLPRRDRCH